MHFGVYYPSSAHGLLLPLQFPAVAISLVCLKGLFQIGLDSIPDKLKTLTPDTSTA